jgi:hypothetical protein
MKSGSLFSCMHCTTVLSFFIGHMQLDKANIVSSLFMALHSLRPLLLAGWQGCSLVLACAWVSVLCARVACVSV